MRRIDFPEWREVLTQAELPERLKSSFEITLRWYLSFCQRGRAEVTVQSARDFIAWAVEEKRPQNWQVEHWKEAIRWFFRAARHEPQEVPQNQRPVESDPPVWLPEDRRGWPEWKVAFLTTLRRRKYSYRTEQSYLVWIERFARHLGTEDLRGQGAAQIKNFLDALALDQRLSASSQRQALNALVFLFREVFEMELGDFSDFRRAKVRTHLPVWLTREEVQRLFACLSDPMSLMAQVMYAGRQEPAGWLNRVPSATLCDGEEGRCVIFAAKMNTESIPFRSEVEPLRCQFERFDALADFAVVRPMVRPQSWDESRRKGVHPLARVL